MHGKRGFTAVTRGFTLVEVLLVITVILILASIAVPSYRQHVRRARETALRQNLYTLRSTIQAFTLDKQRSPNSLDELVTAGYLGVIPKDITGQRDTWQVEYSDELISPEQPGPDVIDVRSGSTDLSTDGTPYNTW